MSGAAAKPDAHTSGDPIGTAQELIEAWRNTAKQLRDFWVHDSGTGLHMHAADCLDAAADALQSRIAEGEALKQALADTHNERAERIAEVERLTARVKAAVNWVQPPFLTPEASPDEVRSRINLLLADIDAAVSQHRKL